MSGPRGEIGTFNYHNNLFACKLTLNAILDTIQTASLYGGRVFGGFVRDIIVPFQHFGQNGMEEREFKDVDLWFKSKESADVFINAMGANFVENKIGETKFASTGINPQLKSIYPFDRKQYIFSAFGVQLAWFDIIVHEGDMVPVNDFDVNCLTYRIDKDGKLLAEAFSSRTVDFLVTSIVNKQMNILEGYSNPNTSQIKRIMRFVNKGWQVFRPQILGPIKTKRDFNPKVETETSVPTELKGGRFF